MVSIGRNTAAADKLKSYLERIEHLLDEIEGLRDDLKDVKGEARNEGFNVAAIVRLVAIRRNKKRADHENELLNDLLLYAQATGTPLDIGFEIEPETSSDPTRDYIPAPLSPSDDADSDEPDHRHEEDEDVE